MNLNTIVVGITCFSLGFSLAHYLSLRAGDGIKKVAERQREFINELMKKENA